jgi:acyl carrier protein
MNNEEILKTLDQVFRKVLKRDNITLTETTTANDVDGWDSLTNMLLISEIEKTFQLHFSFREIVRLKNVGDLCAAIARKTE